MEHQHHASSTTNFYNQTAFNIPTLGPSCGAAQLVTKVEWLCYTLASLHKQNTKINGQKMKVQRFSKRHDISLFFLVSIVLRPCDERLTSKLQSCHETHETYAINGDRGRASGDHTAFVLRLFRDLIQEHTGVQERGRRMPLLLHTATSNSF